MSARFSVTRYWCSTAPAGSSIPASLPTSRAQMPAALTTISASMSPSSVRTRVARRSLTSIAVTRTRSTMRTPPARAPLA